MILVFKKFLQTSIPPLIYVLYAKRYHDFPLKNFRLTVPKNFVEETVCLRKFRVSKNFMPKKGISRVSIKNIVVSQYRKYFVGEPFFVSENFWYRKNLWIRGGRGEGVSRFSVKKCLSHSTEKFRRGNRQCVTNFGYRKILCFRDLSHDCVEIFFVSVLKNFVGEPFWSVYEKKSGIEKNYG